MESTELFEYISATKIRLRKLSPFFAALSLYAEIDFSNEVQLAATNGKKIIFNPITYIQLPPSERDGVFLHELLHMALLHHLRRGVRDHYIFNIAADIVVNGMIVNEGNFKIPKYCIRDEDLEHLSVEEVYELIIKNNKKYNLNLIDLINDQKGSEDKDSKGKVWLFRPEENFGRMNKSSVRLNIPELPKDLFFKGLTNLLRIDSEWIKPGIGNSLYIRPFIFASSPNLQANPSKEYIFLIICCPVKSYYGGRIDVLISEQYRNENFAKQCSEVHPTFSLRECL